MSRTKNRRRGSILVFILVVIVVISVLSLRLIEEGIREINHLSQFHRRDDLRMHAYSAMDVAVGVLNEFKLIEGKLYSPAQGWGDPMSYAGVAPLDESVIWSVRLIDESAKVPIYKVNEKDMTALFALMMAEEESLVDEDDGEPFFDSMMDWVDGDDEERDEGAEDDYYEGLESPYFTPDKKINNFEEFRLIKGFPHDPEDPDDSGIFFDELGNETVNMKHFRDSFSFFNDGPVNINNASPFLKKFLCGDDERLYEDLMEGPVAGGEPYYVNPNSQNIMAMRGKRNVSIGTSATVFRVEVTVTRGKANFQLHAILSSGTSMAPRPPGPGGRGKIGASSSQKLKYPFRVLSIRENENLVD